MSVKKMTERPLGFRSVPVLTDPDVAHYPEFKDFLVKTFELDKEPLAAPGLLDVDGRCFELIFVGRSGQPFPAAIEIAALVEGLEPMDTAQTDKDLWQIMEWLVDGVGGRWTIEALTTMGKIYRVTPDGT
ncbi:MAG: hypothetical protein JJ934_00050 [Pseudomonadales bacterium]|nr:hypothetical protein [Pseudomonadales bacterium]MBO6565017.1 hypothetical protein [Pseudomonadales bacterium]MBO6597248.1 hypothetical protein [Pseudomonadales bacterium]MBO6655246.1 hypothetical protein [Pseudomonadales bacterium]MBO6703877.1 hypothetical protein [Pseudomonadales bacterium]